MSDLHSDPDRLFDLVGAVCDGVASPADLAELDSRMSADHASRHNYIDYCRIHVALRLEMRATRATQLVNEQLKFEPPLPVSEDSGVALANPPAAMPWRSFGNTAYGSVGHFSSGWPVAYLVATVIFAIGLAIGALVHVSGPAQIATPFSPLPSPFSSRDSVVGRITGMVDCRWEGSGAVNQQSETINQKSVLRLGDRLVLKSGLLEITYDTGAKVILQGPVSYEVESPAGGYLSVGKLTAKLEKTGGSGQRSESANQKSEIRSQKSFAVRTPTALITDLGTEFGVEVDRRGVTSSHVFRGSIRVQRTSAETVDETGRILRENNSIRISGNAAEGMVVVEDLRSADFIREIPQKTSKVFDLVDVVAGGDGFSGKRDRGLDPTTGRVVTVQPRVADLVGDGQYHRVLGMPFVDGVFIPDGSRGPVQVDSAGHVFADCPKTDHMSWRYVWAGGKLDMPPSAAMSTALGGVDYASPGHGILPMHANKAITFDLDAIRRANPGYEVVRFRCIAGNVETAVTQNGGGVFADIWILVDGQVRFKRREVTSYSGALHAAFPIHAKERFLTLMATDGGNSYMCDHIVFGDPQLELAGTEASRNATK